MRLYEITVQGNGFCEGYYVQAWNPVDAMNAALLRAGRDAEKQQRGLLRVSRLAELSGRLLKAKRNG